MDITINKQTIYNFYKLNVMLLREIYCLLAKCLRINYFVEPQGMTILMSVRIKCVICLLFFISGNVLLTLFLIFCSI